MKVLRSRTGRGVALTGFLLPMLLGLAGPAAAQQFPPLTGRVVDAANLLSPAEEAALTTKLAALEQASTRQLVVATIPDLQGREIEDYGYRLLRAWGIGQKGADNGTILIVAPAERKVRIEIGYGLEAVLTDAVSSLIIQNQITPAFRANDYPRGINAGVDAIVQQLQAPPEVAERQARAAQGAQVRTGQARRGGSIVPLLFGGAVLMFVILPMLGGMGGRGGRDGRRYRRGGGLGPVGSILLWEAASAVMRSGQGGGGFGGGGGGGFSGGGGSGGGGGASGGW